MRPRWLGQREGVQPKTIGNSLDQLKRSTNAELAQRFHEWLTLERYSRQTRLNYKYTVNGFCKSLGRKRIHRVTHFDVRRYLTRRLPQWSSAEAVNRQLTALRAFFDFLCLGGVVDSTVPRLIKNRLRAYGVQLLPRVLTPSEIERLLRHTRTPRDRAMIELFYSTGCRSSELVGIRLEDIDFKYRRIRVVGKHKQRLVFFGHSAEAAIRRYLAKRECGWLFEEQRPEQRGFVCAAKKGWEGRWAVYDEDGRRRKATRFLGVYEECSRNVARRRLSRFLREKNVDLKRHRRTGPMDDHTTYRVVHEAAFRAGLGEVCPRVLRHTFATHLLEGGADIRVVQQLLGHARLDTTQVYTRVTPVAMAETYRRCHPRGTNNKRVTYRRFLKDRIPASYSTPSRTMTNDLECGSMPRIISGNQDMLLQPWFLDRKMASAIRRLVPPVQISKMRYYFDDYGCLRCGSKSRPYASNGLCNSCHVNTLRRIQNAMRRRAKTYAAHAPLQAIAARQENARKLLKDFYASTRAERDRPRTIRVA
jgi:site-specific recombinase XerD